MDQKQALAERLKQANNILVTVSSSPSVDQLASCIGLTLALNKLDKHGTAVFSGAVPSTIEFLQPDKTIEKNTDSLRDFIIALDKSKADKLRYKVEDKVVKIFITPYRTSINEKDLNFSQGDFNVDVVLALGVHNQADLDQAITAHGRILHDATVATINTQPGGELGTINWLDHNASSLSELAAELVDALNKEIMDTQIATAFLTGIVAETERFSNDKTTPLTMTISAELMGAGANQQLVAAKLEPPASVPQAMPIEEKQEPAPQPTEEAEPPKPDDGTLEISHAGEPEPASIPDIPKDDKPTDDSGESETEREGKTEVGDTTNEALKEIEAEAEADGRPDDTEEEKEEPQLNPAEESSPALEEPKEESSPAVPQIKIDEHGSLRMPGDEEQHETPTINMDKKQHVMLEPPMMGGAMSGGMLSDEEERPAGDPAPAILSPGLLQRGSPAASTSFPPTPPPFTPPQSLTPPPPQIPEDPALAAVAPGNEPPAPIVPPPAPSPVVMTPSAPPAPNPAPNMFQPAPVTRPVTPDILPPPAAPQPPPIPAPIQSAPAAAPVSPQTLSQIEQNVNSPHLQQFMPSNPRLQPPQPVVPPSTPLPAAQPVFTPSQLPPAPAAGPTPQFMPSPTEPPSPPQPVPQSVVSTPLPDVNSARDAALHAYDGTYSNDPIAGLNAQPLGDPLHEHDAQDQQNAPNQPTPPAGPPPMMPPAPGA